MAREEMVKVRMTRGELFMLKVKAAREGRSLSDVVRQAVSEYRPMQPEPELCPNCPNREMEPIWHDEIKVITVAESAGDVEHTFKITGIPAQKCPECGTVTVNFDLMSEIEQSEIRMVNHFMRSKEGWPEQISLEELSRLL